MSVFQSPLEAAKRVKKEVDRAARRGRNGARLLGGVGLPSLGATQKEVVWRRDKAELWRYVGTETRVAGPPVLIVMSLISRSSILDLHPDSSFVRLLLDEGFEVFLLDWGVPDEADAQNTLDTYLLEYLVPAVEASATYSETSTVDLIGYCLGGLFSVVTLSRRSDLPVGDLVAIATPIDLLHMGPMVDVFRDGRLRPEDVIDATGNVPASVVRIAFRMLKPTADLVQYANLWQKLEDDEFVEAYQSMARWLADPIPLSGATFRQLIDVSCGNQLVSGTLELGGLTVDLGDMMTPALSITARDDHIVPTGASAPLITTIGSATVREVCVATGHVGLVVGRRASQSTIPAIVDFLRRSDKVHV